MLTRILSKIGTKVWDLDELSVASVTYMLTPGVVLGSLIASAKAGFGVLDILLSLLYGAGVFFVASLHIGVAEKAGAKFIITIIGCISALSGIAILAYGIAIYLGALS